MLSSFVINNFRAFANLRIERLGNVNLVVGKNNTGKTTLLESLRLFAMGGSLWEIRNLLLDRQEAMLDVAPGVEKLRVGSLFHRSMQSPSIQLGPVDDPANTLRIVPTKIRRAIHELHEGTEYEEASSGADLLQGLAIDHGSKRRLWPVDSIDRFAGGSHGLGPALVPACGVHEKELAHWWDAISGQDAEQLVTECLSMISPIEQIRLVENPLDRPSRMFVARVNGKQRPVPLKSLGGGMVKMFQIALAVQFAGEPSRSHGEAAFPEFPETREEVWQSDEMLLIDELENGIHYTMLPDLWNFIFRMAKILHIQVFVTSHSWDCVEAFQLAAKESAESEAMLIRLERHDDCSKAIVIGKEELSIVTRDKIEVR